MNSFFFWVFAASASVVAYCYFIFPLLVLALARLFPRPVRKGPVTPVVAVVIPAYNEEAIIRRKVENTLALDYPREKKKIVVVSDGSRDATVGIVREYEARGVSLIHFDKMIGKLPALLDALPKIECEIIVFSDASGMLRGEALREIVSNFADPQVGCVCGYYRSPALAGAKRHGELFYWDYEFAIKRAESRWGTLLGATGAVYAVRKNLFTPPRRDIINDDFVIPALIVLRGFRTVLEERAVVEDLDPRMGNFMSRVRVSAGNWQQLFYLRGLVSLSRPAVCWQFISHKLLRMVLPLIILAGLVSLICVFPAAAALAAACAALAIVPPHAGRAGKISSAVRKFLSGNAASLYGMALYLFRPGRLKWN